MVINKSWLRKISAGAAALEGALLLSAVPALAISAWLPGGKAGWLAILEGNWLVVIFKLLAGYNGVLIEQLYHFNLLDVLLLILFGLSLLGLYPALMRVNRVWTFIAMGLPWVGIVLFALTSEAGRSALMGAGMIVSFLMIAGKVYERWFAVLSLLACALLFAGDLMVSNGPSVVMAVLFAAGYVLLLIWLFRFAFITYFRDSEKR